MQVELEIVNKLGLHARASAKLTQLASKYKSEVWITRNNKRVNGKSIMGVMMLAAGFARPTGILTPVSGKTLPDLADALGVLHMALKITTATPLDISRADIAPLGPDGKPLGDGKLDVYDVIGVLRMMLGLN